MRSSRARVGVTNPLASRLRKSEELPRTRGRHMVGTTAMDFSWWSVCAWMAVTAFDGRNDVWFG